MKLFFVGLLLSTTVLAQVKPINEIFSPDPALYPLETNVKVAVIQWNPQASAPIEVPQTIVDAYVTDNRETLAGLIREAAKNGAELIVTPEFAIVGYPDIPELPSEEDNFRNRADLKPYTEVIPGKSTAFFGELARELKVTLHIGMAEVDAVTDEYHNTVAVLGPDGELITKYRKMHLYNVEHKFLVPGKKPVTYTSKTFGKVGMAICSDIYSSHPMDDYANFKLDILAISTSWAQYNSGWSYFTSAAKKVKAITLAANQEYFPDSGVINANGTVQSHIRQTNGIAYGFVPRLKKE